MHILIVDDERPARGELLYMLQQLEAGAIYYEAQNGEEALRIVADAPIDVVFLDINMPGMSGLAVASVILERPQPPLIVFATAYDVHAVRAFQLAALDYVVKPISEERLAQTIVRVRKNLIERESLVNNTEPSTDPPNAALRSYLQVNMNKDELPKLWAERENGNICLVDYAEIMWCVAEEKKVYVQTVSTEGARERLRVRQTLKALEKRLQAHNILRVHKAYLVNLNFVDEIVPWFSGTYVVRMADAEKTEIPMSRQHAKAIKARIR